MISYGLSSQVIKSESTSYDVSFKLKAVKCSAKKTKEAAAREIGVDAKRMFNWSQAQIEAGPKMTGIKY